MGLRFSPKQAVCSAVLLIAGLFAVVLFETEQAHAFPKINIGSADIAQGNVHAVAKERYGQTRIIRKKKVIQRSKTYRKKNYRKEHYKRRYKKKPKFGIIINIPAGNYVDKPKRKVYKRPPRKTVRKSRRIVPVRIADKRYRKKEVIIVIKRSKNNRLARAVARTYKLRMLRGYNVDFMRARVQHFKITDRRSVGTVLAQMKRDRRIRFSQPNYVYSPANSETSEAKADKSLTQYSHSSMRVKKAHNHALGRDVKIAVIDTGVDRTHPAFKDAVISHFNAVQEKKAYRGHRHGTAIAGVLAAQERIVGVAPKAHLLDARAFFVAKNGKPETTTMILLRALQWSYDKGARIFNLSFEGPRDPVIADALEVLHNKGRILVAAAGNGGPKARPAYPAAYSHVIAITAVDKKKKLYKHANRGKYLTLAAPGVGVMVLSTAKSYAFESGTSIAAAHVSGLVALILESRPGISARDVRKIIVKTAQDLGAPGIDASFGAGLADAYSSIQALETVSLTKKN